MLFVICWVFDFFSKLIFSTSFVEWQTDWIPPGYTGRQRANAAPLLEYIFTALYAKIDLLETVQILLRSFISDDISRSSLVVGKTNQVHVT